MCSRGIMRPLLSFSVCLWTFLHFSALLKTSQAECVHCNSSETEVVTGTTTITVLRSNCTISTGNSVFVNGLISGLTPGAVHQIFFNCSSCCTNVTTKPGAVGDLTVTEVTTSSLSLNWTNPVGNSLFDRVQWTDGNFWQTETVTDTSINITNLTAGVQYNITVTAVADDGQTQGTTISVQRYTRPDVVSNITAIGSTTTMSVSWIPAKGRVDSYTVQLNRNGTLVPCNKSLSNTTVNNTCLNLNPGVLYCVVVVTKSGPLESNSSVVCNATFPNPPGPITVVSQTVESINFTWTFPDGMDNNSYNFSVSSINGSYLTKNNWFLLDNLEPGSPYNISVVTVGVMDYKSTAVTAHNYTRPYGITGLEAETINTTTVNLFWLKPLEYKSEYTYQVNTTGCGFQSKTITSESTQISELNPGTNCTFCVSVRAADGTEGEQNCTFAYTRPDVVSNITAIGSTTTMSVSWIPAKGRVDSYTVQLDRNGTLVPCNKSLSNTTVNNTCLDLNPGVLYCVVVVTKSGPLESNNSDVCNATFPNPPGPITVVSQTVESINFTWTFPDGMDNNSYNFSVSSIKGSYLTTNNWFLLDNLESGSPYNISVVTVGVMDYKSTAVTAHSYTRPYGITGLEAETINTTTVNLFWLKPLEYKSEYTYQVNTTGCGFQSKTITSESTQISELNPGTNCTFCVSVRAADGTEGEQNCTFAYTRPDVVSNITAIGSTTTMSVSWIPAKGRVDSYTVQLDRNGTLVPCNNSLSNTTVNNTCLNLNPGVLYCVVVVTKSGPLESNSSDVCNATFPNPPGPITVVSQTVESINFTWTFPDGMDNNSYNFSVSGIKGSYLTTNNWFLLDNLEPGSPYNISVVTVGVMDYKSTAVTAHSYTRPDVVSNITAIGSTTTMSVSWIPAKGRVDSYTVQLDRNGTLVPCNNSLSNTTVNNTCLNLNPGVLYCVVVVTKSGPLESNSSDVCNATFPNPPGPITVVSQTVESINFTWTFPDGMDNNSYNFSVSGINGSYPTKNNWFLLDNLEPGSPYNISVVTVGVMDYKSTAVTAHSYTRPDVVSNITAIGSTTTMSVSWIPAKGRVDSYTVQLNRNRTLVPCNNSLSNTTVNYMCLDLNPGVLYCVVVVTKSGPLENNNSDVCNATFPNPPGPITVVSQTVESINFTWTFPDDMDNNSYNFSVSSINGSYLTKNNWFLLDNLASGSPYNISVVTVGVMDYKSTAVTAHNYTKPYSVKMLRSSGITANAVTLIWEQLLSKPYYIYVLQVTGGSSFLLSTTETNKTVTGLLSGSNYSFTVITETADGTQATPMTVSYFTRPYGITGLEAETINTTTVNLSWMKPLGYKSEYTYQVNTTGCGFQSKTITSESTQISELNPGTNCTFCVSVRAADGTEGEQNCTSAYTRPDVVSNIMAIGSTTTMSVSWIPAKGRVDSYTVQLNRNRTLVPCNKSLSNTTVNNTCLNLNPGVLYCVVVVTKSGPLESNSSVVCNATFPNPPGPITVVSQTVESISFTWTFPDGMDNNSYNFSVSSINGSYLTKNNWFLLDNLEPGSPYNISVVTVGVMDYKSTAVTAHSYTRPDVVSNIMAIGSTTTMSVSWIPAKGRVDSYTVQLNRNRTLVPCNKSLSNTTVNYTCLNLNPGVLYCVVVVTKSGPLENNNSDVCNATFPNPPGPITVVSQTVESISFTWTFPDGMDNNSYNFSVSSIKGSYLTTNNWFLLDNLEPGSPYNISVVTVGVMDYKSTAVTAHSYTNASSVKHLTCEGPNTTNAQIILSWTKPSGQYSAFRITVNNDKINNTEKSCCNHTVSGLVHYTEYTLSVTTESWGQPSAPVTHQCRTGITNPPIPPNYESLVEVTNTVYNRFSLQIDSSLLNNTNGPITDVGVLVTDSILDNTSDLKVYLGKTYKEWKAKATPVYLATVRNATNLKRSVNVYLSIDVGDESTLENYDNGALEATGRYRYAIVLFTRLSLQNKLVNGQTSLVSITKFYPAVPLPLNPVVLAVAVVMGIFIIFVIFLIGFIIYWRRVSNKQPSDIQFQSMRAKVSVAVRVEDFEAYYKKQNSDSSCGFAEEFEELKPVGTSQSKTNGLNLENKPKNRYNNVLPYDSSRVKLSVIHGSPYDDYINANYMPGHNSRKEFIAAQGPLPATVDEFWRMIWEKNVQTMVMLTRCHEQGRIKCEQYWGSGTKYFENITVTTISEMPLEDWTIRDFNIKNVKTAETRTVRHFHFTAWPDHGVPQTTELLISFRHLVREHMDQYSRNSPTVVHCSAGVGRTGTFIAIDRLIFQIERENIVDVFGIVHDLRMHRPLMVQTEDQYVFLNQCAMDIIRSRTGNNVDLIYQNAAAFSIYENVEPQRKHGYNNA